MSKIFKIIKLISITLIVTFTGFIYLRYQNNPKTIRPYPYVIKKQGHNIEEIAGTQVLIIGDRMGKNLSRFIPTLQRLLSKNLSEPIKIYNWSDNGEGIHRSINKLKTLKKFPPVIIYHGANQEFYEKKFDIRDKNKIDINFKLFKNENIASLIMTMPILSKFIYNPVRYSVIGDKMKDTSKLDGDRIMKKLELGFKIYGHEIDELISLAKDKNSNLILTTTPINIKSRPASCENSDTWSIKEMSSEVEQLQKNGKYKEALSKSSKLMKGVVSNAEVTFQHANLLLDLRNINQAKKMLTMSHALNCDLDKPNPVFNSIIRKFANKEDLNIVDFHEIVNEDITQNALFLDSVYPQNIYYQKFIIELSTKIKSILNL